MKLDDTLLFIIIKTSSLKSIIVTWKGQKRQNKCIQNVLFKMQTHSFL